MADRPRYFLTRHRNRTGIDGRTLLRAKAAGRVIQLRCGAFVATDVWKSLSEQDRRRLEAAAAAEMLGEGFTASHRTAAALWGLPTMRPHDGLVHIRATIEAGTRTEHGYRKHAVHDLDLHRTEVDGLPCTTLERTVLDLAVTEPFADAVIAADWALKHRTTKERLRTALDEWAPPRGVAKILRVVSFADERSGSVGESWSRVQMDEEGLLMPDLQTWFSDLDGLIGFVDFFWPDLGLIGEFDGLKKYREAELLAGRSPGDVVADEKIREDRLRAHPVRPRVTRWIWRELVERRLVARLRAAGVPQR